MGNLGILEKLGKIMVHSAVSQAGCTLIRSALDESVSKFRFFFRILEYLAMAYAQTLNLKSKMFPNPKLLEHDVDMQRLLDFWDTSIFRSLESGKTTMWYQFNMNNVLYTQSAILE